MRLAAVALFIALPLSAGDAELDDILRRLESDVAEGREVAQNDLDGWCDKAGPTAAEALRERAEGAGAEVRARIEDQIAFLARLDECRSALALFGDLGWPDVRGKTLARFNTGRLYGHTKPEHLLFLYDVGWVLDESGDEVTLLLDRLATVTRKRDRTLPRAWIRHKDRHPNDRPLPGELAPIDFAKACDQLLAGPPEESLETFMARDQGALPHFARAALYAWWALQLGHSRTAVVLIDHAKGARPNATQPLPDALAETVTSTLRWLAMTGANQGEPREALLSRWRQLAALPWSDVRDEASRMVAFYEDLLKEDQAWKPLSRDEVAALDKEEQVEHWMHAVRDLGARQWSQPGECIVMGVFAGLGEDVVNPAEELLHIGWAALPEVIAHLDDERPTRCIGWCREQWWDSYWVLRYGDVCKTIYEGITGEALYTRSSTSGYMVRDGKAVEAKKAALNWWEDHREGGPDKYYGAMFDGPDPRSHQFAAIKLLREDSAKHLPRVIERAKASDGATRTALLRVLMPYLGPEHREFLELFLEGSDHGASFDAAWALWEKCGTDSGILRLLERVESGDETHVSAGGVVRLLGCLEGDLGAEVVCRWVTIKGGYRRYHALQWGHFVADRRVADALVAALDDRSKVGGPNSYRHCDYAADSLAKLIDKTSIFDLFADGDDADRDAEIVELRAWYSENRESLDWKRLRASAAQRRAR